MVGCLSLILGVIGIFLPVLPTTPFVLLASICFAKSSPRLDLWLHQHPVLGPIISDWENHRIIQPAIKRKAYFFIVVSFSLSIFMAPQVWLKVMLVVIFVVLISWFSTIPTKKDA
uniref:YbaN family protein n=1 Tax=Thaumasiovibrio occultus TaxID=1891184 RepID=UPI000B351130|nr:YbaN family protein [Thaumasiovibrio occultus]